MQWSEIFEVGPNSCARQHSLEAEFAVSALRLVLTESSLRRPRRCSRVVVAARGDRDLLEPKTLTVVVALASTVRVSAWTRRYYRSSGLALSSKLAAKLQSQRLLQKTRRLELGDGGALSASPLTLDGARSEQGVNTQSDQRTQSHRAASALPDFEDIGVEFGATSRCPEPSQRGLSARSIACSGRDT